MDKLMSQRKLTPLEKLGNSLWKQRYLESSARQPRFHVETAFPLAIQSADHLHPRGTINDNSVNYRFNLRLYQFLGHPERLTLMDLGCAGGGLVRSFLEDGHLAIGLEGSDASKLSRSGEWGVIPFHLFTCDLTKPYRVRLAGQPVQFDVITSWDVLEHIPETGLAGMIESIYGHLRPGGYFICSVDLLPDGNPLIGATYHLTLKPADWWERQFLERGFSRVLSHPFRTEDMVRGNGGSLKDWHPSDGDGIHLVLQKKTV